MTGRPGRSILAVLAGFVAVVVLSIVSDIGMKALGLLPASGLAPSNTALAVALVYRSIYAIAGGYITARLAPAWPMQHALISGLVGLILSIAGVIATWNGGPEFGAKWYPLALVAIAMPCAWIGGKVYLLSRN